MKFICKQDNLKKGLSQVAHLAGKNQNLPILNNVLVEIKGGGMVLSTTNLEIGIKSVVRGKVEEEGLLAVPARLFNDYIQNIKTDKIEISASKNNLEIVCDNAHTILKGSDYSEFPLIPEIDKKNTVVFNAEELKNALNLVLFATAYDSTRPEISGVLFDFNKKQTVLAATDSYRLAEKKINISATEEFSKKIIIPTFTLQELNRLLLETEKGQEIKMHLNDNQISFVTDSTSMISRITEGEYPDYKQIIPTESKTDALVNKGQFQQSIKATSLFCRQGINDVYLYFHDNQIDIKALNDQLGESKTTVEAKITGENNQIIFNYHYLLDVLGALSEEEIIFKINNSGLPGMILPEKKDDYLYIIMPIKQ